MRVEYKIFLQSHAASSSSPSSFSSSSSSCNSFPPSFSASSSSSYSSSSSSSSPSSFPPALLLAFPFPPLLPPALPLPLTLPPPFPPGLAPPLPPPLCCHRGEGRKEGRKEVTSLLPALHQPAADLPRPGFGARSLPLLLWPPRCHPAAISMQLVPGVGATGAWMPFQPGVFIIILIIIRFCFTLDMAAGAAADRSHDTTSTLSS